MRSEWTVTPARIIAIGIFVAGWFVGGVLHTESIVATGWGDIYPPMMALGLGLCAWAGVVAWLVAPGHRRVRTGAIAGIVAMAAMIAGNISLMVLLGDRFVGTADSGETWFSLLIESWFWIGIPTAIGAGLGTAGWLVADVVARVLRREAPTR